MAKKARSVEIECGDFSTMITLIFGTFVGVFVLRYEVNNSTTQISTA